MFYTCKKAALAAVVTFTAVTAFAATAVVSGPSVNLNFGALVLSGTLFSTTTVKIAPEGTVELTGSYSQHTGGNPASITFSASDGSKAPVYILLGSSSYSNINLIGCSGGVLSTASVTELSIDSSGPKTIPDAKFFIGGKISFTQLLSLTGSFSCSPVACMNNVIYYRLDAMPTKTVNDGVANVCFNITFRPTPIAITHVSGATIDFGRVCSPSINTTGYVTVSPSGVRSVSNLDCAFNSSSADSFNVTGAASVPYSIVLPSTATLNNGSNTLTIDNFTASCTSCSIGNNGTGSFEVGARLAIPYGTPAGTYNGAYIVSVIY